ncbi:hypothetical protein [Oceanicaulis alexandrii]|nr:hypothetical protein [Oceanicaulis alexandrii]
MFELDNANFVWTFSYELQWEDTRLDTVRSDLEVIGRLLDEADVPVSMDVIVEALAEEDESQGVVADRSPAHRARNAIAYLQDQALTRCINVRSADTGYVWNDRDLTDTEWKARIAEPPVTRTIPVMRVLPPEAVVVLVN